MAEPNRILANFTTEIIRPVVIIDGERYEVAQREDFGLASFARAQSLKSRVYESMSLEELSEEDVARIQTMLDEFLGLVLLDCSAEVIGKLRDGQKLQIVELFNSELQQTAAQAAAPRAVRRSKSSTSTTSSRRSSGSTAARRTTG